MNDSEIPVAAPRDSVMAGPQDVQEVINWAGVVFAGAEIEAGTSPIGIEVRRQDYGTLHFGRSCMDTPIKIGREEFKHGLGTHADSELVVDVPVGARKFNAYVGIDNNYDTQGILGTVEFSVEIDGKEVFHTPTLKGGVAPVQVGIDVPDGTRQIVLKVDTTPDGPAYDQSDWADARFIMADGSVHWLDEGRGKTFLPKSALPFSFVYGGTPSSEILKDWKQTVETKEERDYVEYTVQWTDPKTGLRVTADVKTFKEYPAVDWVLFFENMGTQDTPIIENV